MPRLRTLIERHPGLCSIYLHLESQGRTTVMALDDRFTVQAADEILRALEEMFGEGACWRDRDGTLR